jgi:tetratricopeptide (TPR) repeat protein
MLAYLRRGQTYRRRGDLDASARDFRSAAALDPTATRPLEELGDVLYQLQRYARAADAYERCLRLDDRSARVSGKLALARYRDGDMDAALATLNQTVRLDERNADVHYLLGMCLREKARAPDAIHAFESALALAPGMIAAREELAELYGRLGRRADELEQLQLLAGLDRDRVSGRSPSAWPTRAPPLGSGDSHLGGALERHPGDPLIYRALGQIWLERPRDDRAFLSKAREALERVASTPNTPSDALALYGRALLEEGDTDTAERTLQEATTRYPVEPAAFLLYASAAEKQNHLDAARNALILYGGLVPSDADFVSRATRIAALSLRVNDPATAVDWLNQAASASPNDLRIVAALADAQLRNGDRDAAQATIARGLEKDPKNPALLTLARRAR